MTSNVVHREQRRRDQACAVRWCAVDGHVRSVAAPTPRRINSDESGLRLYDRCSVELDRLDVFRRAWLGTENIDKRGLRDAAETVLAAVQAALHAQPSPLDLDDAVQLWSARRWSLEALIYIRDNRLAKEVEASVSPGGQPLAICIGSAKKHVVQTVRGPIPMHGYGGCLRVFSDASAGSGRRWPRLCPDCRSTRTNDLNKARAALRKRAVGAPRKV